jgi:hypothetical protein
MGAAKLYQMDSEGLEDRVYRLRYNEGQNRCDKFAAVRVVCVRACARVATPSPGVTPAHAQLHGLP